MHRSATESERSVATVPGRRYACAGAPLLPLAPSLFPPDACAIIFQPAASVTTSRRPHGRPWKLKFVAREAPFIEPLMGWTGAADPLAKVELTFPSAAAAVRYAQRHGIPFELRDARRTAGAVPRLVPTCDLPDNDRGVPHTRQQVWRPAQPSRHDTIPAAA